MAKNNVRNAVFAIFNSHLPRRAELGNTGFRKQVIADIMQTFNATLSSASTYYNTAFKQAKLETPELVEGLGRPEGKNNGGRKPKVVVNVVEVATGAVVATGVSRTAANEMIALAAARKQPELQAVMPEEQAADVSTVVEGATERVETPEVPEVEISESAVVELPNETMHIATEDADVALM